MSTYQDFVEQVEETTRRMESSPLFQNYRSMVAEAHNATMSWMAQAALELCRMNEQREEMLKRFAALCPPPLPVLPEPLYVTPDFDHVARPRRRTNTTLSDSVIRTS
jgi:hypothetical protein